MIASVPMTYKLSWSTQWDPSWSTQPVPLPCTFSYNGWYDGVPISPYFYMASTTNYGSNINSGNSIDSFPQLIKFSVIGYYDINITLYSISGIQPPTITVYLNGISVSTAQAWSITYSNPNRYIIGDYILMSILNNDTTYSKNSFSGFINIVVKNI